MKTAPRIAAAVMLLVLLAFCAFGFAATFEPMDAATRVTWRVIYALAGLLSLAALLHICRRRAGSTA